MPEIPRGPSSPAISRGSSLPPPIFPPPNIPLPPSPDSPLFHAQPRTAPIAGYPSSPLASAPISRPGTGDSSIRHQRLDYIQTSGSTTAQGHEQRHRTPTRDSSPSRSVRFVDYIDGERRYIGPFGDVVGVMEEGKNQSSIH
jgi:hypothetical protein